MATKQSNFLSKKTKYRKQLITIGSVIVGLSLLVDVFVVGNIGYLVRWRECGQQPVVVRSVGSFLHDANTPEVIEAVRHPDFFDSKKPVLADPSATKLLCSIDQARQMYSHNPDISKYYER